MVVKAENSFTLITEGDVAILTLEREHCLDIKGRKALIQVIHALGEDLGSVRALILCASHSAAWLVNVAELAGMSQLEARAFSQNGHALAAALASLPVPVIAAVDGPALGGGCELALACDLAIAGEEAKFGQIEAQGGVMPAFGGTWRLEERVGYGRALAMMFTGEVIDAQRAKSYGLVLEVYPSAQLLKEAQAFAQRVVPCSRESIAAIKRVTRAGRGASAALRNQLEEEAFPLLFGPEQQNRMHAFWEQQKLRSNSNV